MSEASLATSLPDAIAMPTSARLRAGESFTPAEVPKPSQSKLRRCNDHQTCNTDWRGYAVVRPVTLMARAQGKVMPVTPLSGEACAMCLDHVQALRARCARHQSITGINTAVGVPSPVTPTLSPRSWASLTICNFCGCVTTRMVGHTWDLISSGHQANNPHEASK